ncbi:hypothetical protein PBY51_024521 [Eleginops maclovinus]|uniref:Uncharacterized protein n=1 Tax=Eleginops maclovinus TaxID=56733 RepID=A0AAN8ARQ7_ELEMC|nr:hypothetical protein PBY51_024521 [Eleginops maclovinus]
MLALSGTEDDSQAAGPLLSLYIPLHRTHTSMARKVRFSPDSSAPLSGSAILGSPVPPEAATTNKKRSSGTH